MKKLKVFLIFLLGIALGALLAVGVYFLTVGEVVWQEYVETKLIPNITLALSTISALCVAALPLVSKIQNSVSSFNQATNNVNATVEKDKEVVKMLGEYREDLDSLMDELKGLKGEVAGYIAPVQKKVDNIERVVHIGFCNEDELVKKGIANEIEKVGAEDEGTEETEI